MGSCCKPLVPCTTRDDPVVGAVLDIEEPGDCVIVGTEDPMLVGPSARVENVQPDLTVERVVSVPFTIQDVKVGVAEPTKVGMGVVVAEGEMEVANRGRVVNIETNVSVSSIEVEVFVRTHVDSSLHLDM